MPILGVQGEAWCPYGLGIYFLNDKQEIDFFDPITKETHHIFTPEKPPNGEWMGALPVSRDGRWLLYAQIDEQSSNLMLVENWR